MRLRAAAACLLLVTFLTACGGNDTVPEAGREILVLGVMGTSDSDDAGILGMIRGVEQAVAEYNGNDDSRYEIDLEEFNTQATPGEAGAGESQVANSERLVGVVGPFAAAEVESLGPAFEASGVPYLIPSVTASSVPQDGWRNFRRLVANDQREGRILAAHAAGRVGGGIVLVTEDSAEGEPFAEGAKEELERLQRAPSRVDTVEPNDPPVNLSAAIVKAGPEAVLYGGGGASGKALIDELRKAGFQGLMVASHQIRDLNPAGLGGGVVSVSPGSDPAASQRFAARYEDRFDAKPPVFALEAYEGALMLLDAVEEVQGDPRMVGEFLRLNRRFRGDSKNYDFDDR
ncbi:MAG TPA: ABC transporter substrate-binding protein, partial [Actinomycetota bacterium]|nr:ABC transporter substrate-binding protein [Actinomycetota bacterium]